MNFTSSIEVLLLSLLGGVVPALLWLFFWLHEDKERPEPRGLIMLTFFYGMLAVIFVIPFQKFTQITGNNTLTFFLWAGLEELFKLCAAYLAALRCKEDNEPIDPLIYMMTAALGFAALENTIFIFEPLLSGNYVETLITGNTRFIGASLLHTLCSAVIGISMALPFYSGRTAKKLDLIIGIIVAVVLHTIFNLFIIKENSGTTIATLGFVWILIMIVMLFFERIKRIYPVKK
jgi:RsiW-degrading membrane proteinase PrsW (M82 family)